MRLIPLLPLLFLTACGLAACGFEPMQAKRADSAESATLSAVAVEPVPTAVGREFTTTLEDLLNPGGVHKTPARYRLRVALVPTSFPAIVAPDGSTLRYNISIDSTYTLTDLASGKTVKSGSVRRTGSFNNVPNAYFSTYVSEQDAMKRLGVALAEDYRMRLAGVLPRLDAGAPESSPEAP